ncbi:hypothetical protein BH10ACI3_BH10ACI3_27530 [soil metagenome]
MYGRIFLQMALISCILILLGGMASAHGICVVSRYKLKSIDSSVTLTNKIPIEGANVTVRKNSRGKVIASELTKEGGRFRFPRITRGTYLVDFEYPTLVRISALITLSKVIDDSKRLFVEMEGKIGEPCGGGDTDIRSLTTTK